MSPYRTPPAKEPEPPRTWRQWLGETFIVLARLCGVDPMFTPEELDKIQWLLDEHKRRANTIHNAGFQPESSPKQQPTSPPQRSGVQRSTNPRPPAPRTHVTVEIPPEMASEEVQKAMAETLGEFLREFETARARLGAKRKGLN